MASRAKAAARRRRGKVPFTRGTSTTSMERAGRLKRGFPLRDPETGKVHVAKSLRDRDLSAAIPKKKSVTPKTKPKARSSDAIQAEERRKAERKMGVRRGLGPKTK